MEENKIEKPEPPEGYLLKEGEEKPKTSKKKAGRPKKQKEGVLIQQVDTEIKKSPEQTMALSDGNANDVELIIRWIDKDGIAHEDSINPSQLLRKITFKGVENGELTFEFIVVGNYSIFIGFSNDLELNVG